MNYIFKEIYYCLGMNLKTLEINVSKYLNLILLIFLSGPRLAWQACLKKTGVKLELLTNNMLMMFEKGNKGGIFHPIHRHTKTNNRHMKNYDKKNIESSYLIYLDASDLCG